MRCSTPTANPRKRLELPHGSIGFPPDDKAEIHRSARPGMKRECGNLQTLSTISHPARSEEKARQHQDAMAATCDRSPHLAGEISVAKTHPKT
jgi:hypothetical protein